MSEARPNVPIRPPELGNSLYLLAKSNTFVVIDVYVQFEDGDTELDKFIKFIQSPIPLQRLVYSKRVAEVLKDGASGEKVAPLLSVVAGDPEHVIRQALAGSLPAVLSVAVEKQEQGAILLSVLNCLVILAKDSIIEVREAAMQSIIEVAPLLSKEQRENLLLADVLGMIRSAESLDDVAFAEDVKTSALTILNEISPLLGEVPTRDKIIPQFISLSSDQSFRVRKACAQNISLIAQTVSREFAVERILPSFIKLAKDPIWSVRKGSIESIVDFTKAVDKNTRKNVLIPLMVKFTSDVSRWVRNAAYRALGPFIYECEEDLIASSVLDLYNGIPGLNSSVVDAEVSFFCAYNFPAVISRLGRDRWSEVSQTYEGLCRDTKFKVRKTLAYSLHEIDDSFEKLSQIIFIGLDIVKVSSGTKKNRDFIDQLS
jgi:serine/threonine-protein phosphatase 4 regulatory subunit 1